MTGVFNLSVAEAVNEAEAAKADVVNNVLLFGLPDHKDDIGSLAYDPEAPVQTAIRAIKRASPETLVITDVCLCEYTDHGHCGIIIDDEIANDPTVDQLVRAAVSHASAGADIVAPSDMMDGRVGAIRQALDKRGFENTAILSYAAKYCSAFYGPFRDAAGSTPQFGDRRSHQMDPANVAEALREVALDIEEGADMVMVKPALPYLDVLTRVKERFGYPTAAYHVSGEYAMLKAAARNGWIDEPRGLVKALAGAARDGTSFGAPSPLEIELGAHVMKLMPSIERVRFVNSGTEATMSAIRVARAATGRERIVKFEGCYHGHADPFLVKAGSGALTLGTTTRPGVTRAASADTLSAVYNDVASVERLVDAHRGQIAAIIVEPIAGNMGVVPPADGFLRALRQLCSTEKSVLIFDEVISGFRAGPGGAQQATGV